MSELGFGDEKIGDDDVTVVVNGQLTESEKEEQKERDKGQRSVLDVQALGSLPIVVIRNYASKGGANKEELLTVLAAWTATLIENQVGC
jgi:RNA12 protein